MEDLAGWSPPSSMVMIKVLIRDPSAGEKAELIEKRLKRTQEANRREEKCMAEAVGGGGGWLGLGGRKREGGEISAEEVETLD